MFNKPRERKKRKLSDDMVEDPEMDQINRHQQQRHEDQQKQATKNDNPPSPRSWLVNYRKAHSGEIPQERQTKAPTQKNDTIEQGHDLSPIRRSVRSTRATSGFIDLDPETLKDSPKAVFKFSIDAGLGPRWHRPLQYGTGRHRALVNFEDLAKLDEDEMLNDELVDFYLIYLYDQAKVPQNTVYYFNSHFFTTLVRSPPGRKGEINYEGVKRWAKEDLFSYDFIVVPICEDMHWYLAIICNASNIFRKSIPDSARDNIPSLIDAAENTSKNADPSHEDDAHIIDGITEPSSDKPVDRKEKDTLMEAPSVAEKGLATPLVPNTRESSLEETGRLKELAITDQSPKEKAISKGIIGNTPASPSGKRRHKKRAVLPKKFPPDEPIIMILDSLGNSHPKTGRALKEYIFQEGLAKRETEARIEQNVFYVRDNHIPMQQNFTDCGVYLLGYVQRFFENPRRFVSRALSREMDPEIDWPEMSAVKIRDAMRDILLNMGGEQGLTQVKKKKKKPNQATAPEKSNPVTGPSITDDSTDPSVPAKADDVLPTTEQSIDDPPRRHSPQVVIPVPNHNSSARQDVNLMGEETKTHLPSAKDKTVGTAPMAASETRSPSQHASPSITPISSPKPLREQLSEQVLPPPSSTTVVNPTDPPVHEHSVLIRGSSLDPIPIDDSQEVQTEPSPRSHRKPAPLRADPTSSKTKHSRTSSPPHPEPIHITKTHRTKMLLERTGNTKKLHVVRDSDRDTQRSDRASRHVDDVSNRSEVIEETPEPQA
ncbi:cysteine proteinase [Aaosphaeria arxii CBS 175.79]|uniref:Cysteine proteinase n=1 Tax=Aaosphaeria arxii CBS 175.79 TaxID=1450172 RepID=A0A6A5Y7H8_9PLEO|nr:cysteine proteinase [Aaosphaeria arxii CBS 175.79]KAF2021249.1 cysteine proteinase [Aaosphaeria arxii CBS 175.79]